MKTFEVNFDGLVGPTHNYAGLSFGNIASNAHARLSSSPKSAALQGLDKMKMLMDMGLKQAVLPPHERPHIPTLISLGFNGKNDAEILASASKSAPDILANVSSASAMWVANAATISPFSDTYDGKTHITPANLTRMFHRSIEVVQTSRILKNIFQGDDFIHHPPMPGAYAYSDEGAANHTRLCQDYNHAGVALFVHGDAADNSGTSPSLYPARQTLKTCQAMARVHGLDPERTVFAQQHPQAIDAGVFHNDVIAVGNKDVFLYHERAFIESETVIRALKTACDDSWLNTIMVKENEVNLEEAVASYMFNSQLLSVPGQDGMTMIVPQECNEILSVKDYLENHLTSNSAISKIEYLDLKQSMNNGGGPACLRLRVIMNEKQIEQSNTAVYLDDLLYEQLKKWVEKHYRDRLHVEDLQDPGLLNESRAALDHLSQILKLGSVYDFQQE